MVRDGEDEAENAGEESGTETIEAASEVREGAVGVEETAAAENVDSTGVEEAASGSIQANLKKMFERVDENEESEPDIAMDGAAEPEEGV